MGYKILIVDDSEVMRLVIKKSILLSGLDVGVLYEASNGVEGLRVLSEEDIHLVFTDLIMPVMDGLEMVKRMEEQGQLESIPVVVVSTRRDAALIEKLKKRRIRAYIKKPFRPETLRDRVLEILGGEPDENFALVHGASKGGQ